jgi:type I restriction enzyme R subunit
MQILKTFILEQGKVEKENLIDRPFTNLHPKGIRGLFSNSELTEIIEFIEEIG